MSASRPRLLRLAQVALAVLLFSVLCYAAKHFVMPSARPARSYLAHDDHTNEGVSLGLAPYDSADKTSIFSIHYNDIVHIPVLVVITAHGEQHISSTSSKGEPWQHDRTKSPPATDDDIYRRISRPVTGMSTNPLPWPKKTKGAVSKEAQDEIQNSQFAAKAVEPHSTQSGFMFFDVAGIDAPLAGARFYLTGVHDSKGTELMYFEVPLENYLSSPAKP